MSSFSISQVGFKKLSQGGTTSVYKMWTSTGARARERENAARIFSLSRGVPSPLSVLRRRRVTGVENGIFNVFAKGVQNLEKYLLQAFDFDKDVMYFKRTYSKEVISLYPRERRTKSVKSYWVEFWLCRVGLWRRSGCKQEGKFKFVSINWCLGKYLELWSMNELQFFLVYSHKIWTPRDH